MNENYYLKLNTVYFFICIITVYLIGCGYSKLSSSEAEKNVKTFLDNKYGQDFTVKTVKFNEATTNEAHFGETPAYFNLEATSNGKTSYVIYTKDMRYSNEKDKKYPYTHELIKENIEDRVWRKEATEYYSKLISKYYDDGYMKEVHFLVDQTPSRVGMSIEEYVNELFSYSTPFIAINYVVFVDDLDGVRINDEFLKKIDNGIRIKGEDNRQPDRYFSEFFIIVSKKDKEEYIKKIDEYNKINSDYYGSSTYDRNDRKKADEYWEKIRPINKWFDDIEHDACSFRYNEQYWMKK